MLAWLLEKSTEDEINYKTLLKNFGVVQYIQLINFWLVIVAVIYSNL